MGKTVPNPYLAAVRSRKTASKSAASTVQTALDRAVTAMENGAWVGGKSDEFYSGLTSQRSTARNAADNSTQAFQDKIDEIVAMGDELVEPGSWYCRWRNL